jgi:SAM domain (Sterile alpha motif)/Adenylate and Guanylate cyclase catalytic domain
MQQIADWLKKLGMSEYTDRFVENHIDESIIRELTDQDLKDLGVVSLGHRRKMLRASDLGNVSAAVAAPSTPVATAPTLRDEAERRQLTVMFTDLVGSTALSAKLDPEDLRSMIGAYHKCVAEAVARNKSIGSRRSSAPCTAVQALNSCERGCCRSSEMSTQSESNPS